MIKSPVPHFLFLSLVGNTLSFIMLYFFTLRWETCVNSRIFIPKEGWTRPPWCKNGAMWDCWDDVATSYRYKAWTIINTAIGVAISLICKKGLLTVSINREEANSHNQDFGSYIIEKMDFSNLNILFFLFLFLFPFFFSTIKLVCLTNCANYCTISENFFVRT